MGNEYVHWGARVRAARRFDGLYTASQSKSAMGSRGHTRSGSSCVRTYLLTVNRRQDVASSSAMRLKVS